MTRSVITVPLPQPGEVENRICRYCAAGSGVVRATVLDRASACSNADRTSSNNNGASRRSRTVITRAKTAAAATENAHHAANNQINQLMTTPSQDPNHKLPTSKNVTLEFTPPPVLLATDPSTRPPTHPHTCSASYTTEPCFR